MRKVSIKLMASLLAILLLTALLPMAALAAPEDYDAGDVAFVNTIIANSSLNWTQGAPESWSRVEWNDAVPKRITRLDISQGEVTGILDTSPLTALTTLECNGNLLSGLNVSANDALVILVCAGNPLGQLYVNNNLNLQRLFCDANRLTSLEVSNLTSLKELTCWGNQLTTLDLSRNAELFRLNIGQNRFSQFDVSQNLRLEVLGCGQNPLTALDVSANRALTELTCELSPLTALDVRNNPLLTILDCQNNQIKTLDVSQNPALHTLRCDYNQLTTLDVSHNPFLDTLICDGNKLTELDVTLNTRLTYLFCRYNQMIKESDVKRSHVLTKFQFIPQAKGALGYAFGNDASAFGYGANVRNPVSTEVFKRLYPTTWRAERRAFRWGGSCFGMAATAVLFYNGEWAESDYMASARNALDFPEAKKLPALLKEIETYQVFLQNQPFEVWKSRNRKAELRSRLKSGVDDPFVLWIMRYEASTNSFEGSHAIVLLPDTIQMVGDMIVVQVYDSNYPFDPLQLDAFKKKFILSDDGQPHDHWQYDTYGGEVGDFFAIADLTMIKDYIDGVTENPLVAYDSKAKLGTSATGTITAQLPSGSISLPPDYLEGDGRISRLIIPEGDQAYQQFTTTEQGKLGFSAVAQELEFTGFIFNGAGGVVLTTIAQTKNLPYTLTVEPGKSVLLDSAGENLQTELSLFFSNGGELLELVLSATHTGPLSVERTDNGDFLLTGKNLKNVTIKEGESVLFSADTLSDKTLLQLAYDESGTIIGITARDAATPNTGDEGAMAGWMMVMLACACAIACILKKETILAR